MLFTHFGNKSQCSSVVEGGSTLAALLYHQCNQSIHVTHGMTIMSLSASLHHKTSAATDCVCQITLNWILLHINYAKSH